MSMNAACTDCMWLLVSSLLAFVSMPSSSLLHVVCNRLCFLLQLQRDVSRLVRLLSQEGSVDIIVMASRLVSDRRQ